MDYHHVGWVEGMRNMCDFQIVVVENDFIVPIGFSLHNFIIAWLLVVKSLSVVFNIVFDDYLLFLGFIFVFSFCVGFYLQFVFKVSSCSVLYQEDVELFVKVGFFFREMRGEFEGETLLLLLG